MPTNDLDQVIEQLGITADEIKKNANKFNMSAKEAIAYTVVSRARTPSLPKNPRELDAGLNKNNPDSGLDNMKKVGMRYSNTPRDVEAATSGLGSAIAGGIGGSALGPGGAVAGAMGGAGIGAAMSYIMDAITNSPGEATSANRVLDVAGPLVGGGIGKLSKLGPTAKSLTNTAADTLMAYMADAEDNKRSGTDGKNPVGRAMATAGMGGILTPLGRQAQKQLSNADLVDATSETISTRAQALEGGAKATMNMWNQNPKMAKESATLAATPALKQFVKDNPDKLYDYVLSPITGAKNQAELQKGAAQFKTRLDALPSLTGGDKEEVMQGVRSSFFNSLAKSEDGARISNPDSFKMRLDAMGPQVVDEVMGKDSYAKLSMLSQASSKAGALGRFAIKMGDGYVTVAKMVPLDQDSKLTNKALDVGKLAALASTPLSGPKGAAIAGGLQAYEVYKIGIDKLLNKTDKKTLAALSSGLLNSTSNSVVNKLTEWFEKNADEKTRVPLEEPPKLF